LADPHSSGQDHAWSDVGSLSYMIVVLHDRASIDECQFSNIR
jgi:hypothetical protein